MLPAEDGDCLLVEAVSGDGSTTTLLIDGGRGHTYSKWATELRRVLGERAVVDLFVVTHIDADHIGGAIAMLEDAERGFHIRQIWFNGHPQVEEASRPPGAMERFGVAQADDLSTAIASAEIPWNQMTAGGPIHAEITTPRMTVGHMDLTVLTPTRRKLGSMAGVWRKALAEATAKTEEKPEVRESFGAGEIDVVSLASQPDEIDNSRSNGSSIGLLVEAFGVKFLLAGDCHPDDLAEILKKMEPREGVKLEVDVFKISHHGARKNTTRTLLESVESSIYAISTNGRHGHPEDRTLAKIVLASDRDKTLAFNYRTESTERWDEAKLKTAHRYKMLYPELGADGYLCIESFEREGYSVALP